MWKWNQLFFPVEMKLSNIIRYAVVAIFLALLVYITFTCYQKVAKEETVISHRFIESEVDLPSMTICVKWLDNKVPNTKSYFEGRNLSLPNSENWTFEDYMEKSFRAENVIQYAWYNDQPGDKNML